MPVFYGYVPASFQGKLTVLFWLFTLSFFNLAVRSFSFVLLFRQDAIYALAVFGMELAGYLIVKVIQKDLTYYPPLHGVDGILMVVLAIPIVKIIADWTAMVQMRHRLNVGMFFTPGLVITLGIGIGSMFLNKEEEEEEGKEAFLNSSTTKIVMLTSCIGMVIFYVLLLKSINQKYIKTFFTTKSGREHTEEEFFEGESDKIKFETLSYNRNKWVFKIGEEFKMWLNEHLQTWLDEGELLLKEAVCCRAAYRPPLITNHESSPSSLPSRTGVVKGPRKVPDSR